MPISQDLIKYIIRHRTTLIQIDFVRELWMIPERLEGTSLPGSGQVFSITTPSPLYTGKLFVNGSKFFGVVDFKKTSERQGDGYTYEVVAEETGIDYDPTQAVPLCTPQDTMTITASDIENYLGTDSLQTTIGRYILNYQLLVYPFNNVIEYINAEIKISKLQKLIADALLNKSISVADVKDKYINILSLFGQSNDIVCPNISEKTIVIPQSIHDLRDKLINDNRAALDAGDASVMSDIEHALIDAYKDHLEGDSSQHFLLKAKYYNVVLKKLFLTQGMTEIFGQPGKFTFVENPMGYGWKEKDLPVIFNEVRQGSYSRAIETADGGVIAKLILRVLQDIRLDIPDCGAVDGEHVTADLETLQDFTGNYIIEQDGTDRLITEDIFPDLMGKDLIVRTPGFCKAPQGYCAKCFGYLFEELGQKSFAPVANDFARNQTTASLKKMHGSSHMTVDVSDLNKYVM